VNDGPELRVEVPDEFVEAIARRAAAIVRAELAPPEWLTLEEAAGRYRVSAGALRWRARRGRLPGAVKDEGRWLVNARELDQALAEHNSTLSDKRGERRANGPAPGTGG
jgi:Helix-turn-helix domain